MFRTNGEANRLGLGECWPHLLSPFCLGLLLSTSAFPVIFLHEFLDISDILFGPLPYLKHSTEADELSRLDLAGSYPSVDRIPLRCLLCSNCAQVPPSRLRRSSRLRCADQSRQRCCSARRRSASCAQRFALRPSAESPCGSCCARRSDADRGRSDRRSLQRDRSRASRRESPVRVYRPR